MSSESISMKQPIRRLEIPISKFNDVAIPHHLDLLRRHKDNLKKYERLRDWDKVQKEQVNASRLVKQLEQLLYEMDTLRSQVEDGDIDKFDKLTAKARASTINAIQEYLDMKFEPPPKTPPHENDPESPELHHGERFLQLQTEAEDLKRQEACLHAWNSLQGELHQLHQLFVDFNKLIHDQREHIDTIEDNIVETEENVKGGTKFLQKAAKLKVATYPIAGALLGTCIGGPVGLIAGLKLGGLTAIGCGLLGFTGATIMKKKHLENLNKTADTTELKPTGSQKGLTPLQDNSKQMKKDL
ncbi:syntaxin-17 [Diachasma alloeum]|uniref:syntaxin-17 n=1 Tax=Diachasma alloeum TaxID=454923 RepID=UPI00073838B3|nr:syntaxin-17 [Diachasma alloeum]